MKQINVILLRGWFGETFSRGMDVLAMRLKKVPGVDFVAVDAYENWEEWARTAAKWKDPVIPIGHSFGANAAVMMACYLGERKIQTPLLVTFDPSPYPSLRLGRKGPPPVPENVTQAVNFFQQVDAPIRGVELRRSDGSSRHILNDQKNMKHIDIDDDPDLHRTTVNEITKVVQEEALVA